DVTTQTALVFLAFTLAGVGGALAAAAPSDRFDKRALASLAVAAIALALVALAAVTSLWAALAAAAAAGFAWGAFAAADWALANTLLPSATIATGLGIWNIATTLPQVAAPLLAAPLVRFADAHALGLGPRCAMLLAAFEFSLGAAGLRRLPRG
ncbi:MAG: hypothetical protein ACREM2_11205, partial [Vulcanimicrobiaceae bacterium]